MCFALWIAEDITSRLFTLKGWHVTARGNAPGIDPRPENLAL